MDKFPDAHWIWLSINIIFIFEIQRQFWVSIYKTSCLNNLNFDLFLNGQGQQKPEGKNVSKVKETVVDVDKVGPGFSLEWIGSGNKKRIQVLESGLTIVWVLIEFAGQVWDHIQQNMIQRGMIIGKVRATIIAGTSVEN